MNKFLIIAIGAAVVATPALADHHGKKGDYAAKKQAKLEAHFGKVDADGSGNISRAEFLAYRAAKAEKEWDSQTDEYLGDDGELSIEEAKAYHEAKRAAKKEKYKAKKKKSGGADGS